MHSCYTISDWIDAWAPGEALDHPLGACGDCEPTEGTGGLCPDCLRVLDHLPGVPDEVVECPCCRSAADELEELLERLEHFDPAVAREALDVEPLYAALTAVPAAEQASRIAQEPRFRTWSLCQRFLSEAEARWRHDPGSAHAHTATGILLAEVLDEEAYHPRWVADLRAKAHAYLGNAQRILARFEGADRELEVAMEYVRLGAGSGVRGARVLSLRASLRMDQGRYDEADQTLERLGHYYRTTGQRTELARIQLKCAAALGARGEHRAAAEECAQAFGNLDPSRQCRLSILACQNAVFYLVRAGEIGRARSLFAGLAPTDERMVLLQRRWIEADLLLAEGKLEQAAAAYADTRRGYAAQGLPYDVALVSLDEAVGAYERGDLAAVEELTGQAGALLRQAGARRETLAVLRVLTAAIEQGTVTRSVLTAIRKRVADGRPSC